MFCALLTSRYQVSVYRTNGPLVYSLIIDSSFISPVLRELSDCITSRLIINAVKNIVAFKDCFLRSIFHP